jgi:hypothetical protein
MTAQPLRVMSAYASSSGIPRAYFAEIEFPDMSEKGRIAMESEESQRLRCGWGAYKVFLVLEDWDVASGTQVYRDRVVLSFSLVVLLQLGSEATSFCADDGILAWVIGRAAVIDLRPDDVLFEAGCIAFDDMLDDESQKFA